MYMTLSQVNLSPCEYVDKYFHFVILTWKRQLIANNSFYTVSQFLPPLTKPGGVSQAGFGSRWTDVHTTLSFSGHICKINKLHKIQLTFHHLPHFNVSTNKN
jgi:hypothetical protein